MEVGINSEDFELVTDTENWKATELMEADPLHDGQLCAILFAVDFEEKITTIETRMNINIVPGREWNKLVRTYDLPSSVDASKLEEFYNMEVKPILQEMGQYFEKEWDGRNYVGVFNFPEGCDLREYEFRLAEVFSKAHTHNAIAYFDLLDAFATKAELVEAAGYTVEVFVELDLDNEKIVDGIKNALQDESTVYLTDLKADLEEVQDELRDEDEE